MKKEAQQKEEDEFIRQRMEADQLYQAFEEEKSRQRQTKLNVVAKTNLKQVVSKFSFFLKTFLND